MTVHSLTRQTEQAPVTVRAPIFIVGHPRSGSTLLRSVLSAHSDIALTNEPDLIMGMRIAGYNVDDVFDRPARQQLIDALKKIRGCRRHLDSLPADLVDRFLADDRTYTVDEVYETLLPRTNAAKVWGDKAVGQSLFVVNDLIKLYPGALIIHIKRDPRAVLLSIYRKRIAQAQDCIPPFCRESIAFFAYESMRWNAAMDAWDRAQQRCKSTSIYELAFEDFVSDPQRELHSLLNAIGVPYEDGMLDATRRQNDTVLQDDCAYAHQRIDKSIDASRAATAGTLPDWASYILQRCADESLRRQGYHLTEKPGLFQRSVINAGLLYFRKRMSKRLSHENNWYLRGLANTEIRARSA